MENSEIYLVTQDWTIMYTDPIILEKGQKVIIDNSKIENDPEWKNWVWCISENNSGWGPVQILSNGDNVDSLKTEAIVLENYSAKELNVTKGEKVKGNKIVNGWLWCAKIDNEDFGWLPMKNLSKI